MQGKQSGVRVVNFAKVSKVLELCSLFGDPIAASYSHKHHLIFGSNTQDTIANKHVHMAECECVCLCVCVCVLEHPSVSGVCWLPYPALDIFVIVQSRSPARTITHILHSRHHPPTHPLNMRFCILCIKIPALFQQTFSSSVVYSYIRRKQAIIINSWAFWPIRKVAKKQRSAEKE